MLENSYFYIQLPLYTTSNSKTSSITSQKRGYRQDNTKLHHIYKNKNVTSVIWRDCFRKSPPENS